MINNYTPLNKTLMGQKRKHQNIKFNVTNNNDGDRYQVIGNEDDPLLGFKEWRPAVMGLYYSI
jgi:hypothetical protein